MYGVDVGVQRTVDGDQELYAVGSWRKQKTHTDRATLMAAELLLVGHSNN
jgi:hypothetical protein